MEFSSKNVETEKKKGPKSAYLSFGVNELKIEKMTVEIAGTGSPRVVMHMQGRPIKEEGFQGLDGAQGQVGRVRSGWLKRDESKEEFITKLANIATAMGRREQLDAITEKDFEKYIEQASNVLSGGWARFCISCEQFNSSTNGKTKDGLHLPRYNYVEAIDVPTSKLKFDKTKLYHFKPVELTSRPDSEETIVEASAPDDDMPF